MSMLIAAILCIALLAVSIAHFVWSAGGTWPINNGNEKLLAQTVVGSAGVEKMPPRWMSLLVALLTLAATICAMALADHDGGGWWLSVGGVALGLVFLARGLLGFSARWQAQTPTEPFRSNDRKLYSPLCLVLGIGFLALVALRLF